MRAQEDERAEESTSSPVCGRIKAACREGAGYDGADTVCQKLASRRAGEQEGDAEREREKQGGKQGRVEGASQTKNCQQGIVSLLVTLNRC